METFAYLVTSVVCLAVCIGTFVLVHWLSQRIDEQLHGPARKVVNVACALLFVQVIIGSVVLAALSFSRI